MSFEAGDRTCSPTEAGDITVAGQRRDLTGLRYCEQGGVYAQVWPNRSLVSRANSEL